MHDGDREPPQLRLNHKVPQDVAVPDEPLIRTLVEGELGEVGIGLEELVAALEGVGEVVRVGVVESRGVQDASNHAQVGLVLSLLQKME